MHRLYLIDGMSIVFRAYHAMAASALRSASGELTSAVFGFANIITSLIDKEKPEYMAVVFDTQRPTFRHEMYDAYKANRAAFPDDLVPQLARIKELLDLLSIPRAEMPGFEADDVIGAMAKRTAALGCEVVCVTSDKDYYQLVDSKISLYKPSRTPGRDFDIVTPAEVLGKFGVAPEQVIDVLAIIGDSSDNVPGVKGVGEKSAIPLVQQFGTLEKIYESLDSIASKAVRAKLEANRDLAFLSKKLVTIDTTLTPPIEFEECKLQQPQFEQLNNFFLELGLYQLGKKWASRNRQLFQTETVPAAASHVAEPASDPATMQDAPEKNYSRIGDIDKEYIFVDSMAKFDSMIAELSGAEILSVDIETSSLDRENCDVVGISLCAREGRAFYVPTDTASFSDGTGATEPEQLDLFAPVAALVAPKANADGKNGQYWIFALGNRVYDKLKDLLGSALVPKCGQNIKFDAFILRRFGVIVRPIVFDSMIASYLLNPDLQHNMDALAQKWLSYIPIPISSLIGEKISKQISMKDLDPATISDYAAEDADVTLKLRNVLAAEIEKENLAGLASDVEFPLVEVLVDMETEGVSLNVPVLDDLTKKIDEQLIDIRSNIFAEAGEEFNIDSPKQLGAILFEKLMIPSVKSNKTGYSTDVTVLEQLAPSYPIANHILEYRSLVKIKSTYSSALPKLINPKTGRLHTTFNQTIASTGRLSSTAPNLQNIPIRTDIGREIRKAFIPREGWELISADYSQVELRIMAYYSKDEHLVAAFREGLDVHSATASVLYGASIQDVTSEMRRTAKTVNFGIMYGLGAFGLAQRLGISRTDSSEIIKNYFEKYPGIRRYIDETIDSTRRLGYATTLCGRRRYFANINAKNQNLRAADERAAINMPIQGTASDMMKIAMIRVHSALNAGKFRSKLVLQVHDELVLDVHPEEIEDIKTIVKREMELAMTLGEVPVVAEIGIGKNWLEAH